MQLLQNKHWQQILKTQQSQKKKEVRTHVIALNPPENLYSYFDFIQIPSKPRYWNGLRLDTFEDARELGDLCVWWLDVTVDLKSTAAILQNFVNAERYTEQVTAITFAADPDMIGVMNDFIALISQSITSSSATVYSAHAAQIHQRTAKDLVGITHQKQFEIKIPHVVICQSITLRIRKLAAKTTAAVLTDLRNQQQQMVFIGYFRTKPVDSAVNCIIGGQDDLQVIELLEEPAAEAVVEAEVKKLDVQQLATELLQQYEVASSEQMIVKPSMVEQSDTGIKIGSRFKKRKEGAQGGADQ